VTVTLDHMIVAARDKEEAASFLSEVLGLPAPVPTGPFLAVRIGHGLTLDYADGDGPIRPLHLAFAVSEPEFAAIFARVEERDLPFWADPQCRRPGEIAQRGSGRGFYFRDPDNHFLEVLTREEQADPRRDTAGPGGGDNP
jgi:catechol 2,3-dioxygenase-like lactoylglutathione lyase family enzyme